MSLGQSLLWSEIPYGKTDLAGSQQHMNVLFLPFQNVLYPPKKKSTSGLPTDEFFFNLQSGISERQRS